MPNEFLAACAPSFWRKRFRVGHCVPHL